MRAFFIDYIYILYIVTRARVYSQEKRRQKDRKNGQKKG